MYDTNLYQGTEGHLGEGGDGPPFGGGSLPPGDLGQYYPQRDPYSGLLVEPLEGEGGRGLEGGAGPLIVP
jgi:hypothetical protein